MNSVERVKQICKERKIPISKLEKDLGFSNGYISQLRKGVFPDNRLVSIAHYLDVTVEYLMTGKTTDWKPELTAKDEKDIKKAIDDFKNKLSTAGVMYDGEPLDDETKEAVLAAVELAERTARLAAKEKFTPKKYKK